MALKYVQLADELRKEIRERAAKGMLRLPTEMELMKRYSVSRQTVRQALLVLTEEGLIEKRQGSGTYLSARARRQETASKSIAIITPCANTYTASAVNRDIQTVFSAAGYESRIFPTGNLVSMEREILLSLLEHPVQGILVRPTKNALPNPNTDLYQKLMEQGSHIVFLGQPYADLPSVHAVYTDDYLGSYLMTQHLIRQGHQQIAGIFNSDELEGLQRFQGCLNALRDGGLSFYDRHFLLLSSQSQEILTGSVSTRLLEPFVHMQVPDCSAVLCQSDETAHFLIRELKKHGIHVPRQIAAAAFGSFYPYLQPSESSPVITATTGDVRLWIHAAKCLVRLIEKQTVSGFPFSWLLPETNPYPHLPG